MNKNLRDIDNLFKNSIDGHTEEVPPDVWNNIDDGLDKKQTAIYKRKYFTVRSAAILLLLIGGTIIAPILHYRSSETHSKNETVVTNASGNKFKKGQNEAAKEVTVGQRPKDEKVIVFNEGTNHRIIEKRPVLRKENSKEFKNSESGLYSKEKNGEISVNATGKEIYVQKPGEKVKTIAITDAATLELVDGSHHLTQETSAKTTSNDVQKETSNRFTRTAYVDVEVLGISKVELNNSLPDANLTKSIVHNFTSISTSSKTVKLRYGSGSWSLAPLYAQNTNLNTLKDDDHFRDPRNNSREAKRTEQETKSFTVGLGVQKEFGGNFILQTGLQYFSSKTTIEPKMIFAEPDNRGEIRYRFNCSSGDSYIPTKNGLRPTVGDSIKTNSSKTSLFYLQVPLLASYKIALGRLSVLPSAGIQTNFLLSGKLTSSFAQPSGSEEISSSIDGLRPMYFSGVLQPQLNYMVNDRISFDFNPNINFSLTPINRETAVKTYQNIFCLGAGLRIKL